MNERLLKLGFSYFTLARTAVFFGFMPNSGNLYHLALELLFKSALSKQYSSYELKCKYGHNLKKLWKDFKKLKDIDETEFDLIVKNLDKFEPIRYLEHPSKKGIAMTVDFGDFKSKIMPNKEYPTDAFIFNFDEMDKLLKFVIKMASINPAFIRGYLLKQEGFDMYQRENKSSIFQT